MTGNGVYQLSILILGDGLWFLYPNYCGFVVGVALFLRDSLAAPTPSPWCFSARKLKCWWFRLWKSPRSGPKMRPEPVCRMDTWISIISNLYQPIMLFPGVELFFLFLVKRMTRIRRMLHRISGPSESLFSYSWIPGSQNCCFWSGKNDERHRVLGFKSTREWLTNLQLVLGSELSVAKSHV